MRRSLIRARGSSGQIVPTSSNTRVVTGQTVNYFGSFMKGAQFEDKYWETDLALDDELDEGTELDGIDFDYIL
jgi:hypothetical protein